MSFGEGGGSVRSLAGAGAGLGFSEVRTPVSRVFWRGGQRDGADHGGLDRAGGHVVLAPSLAVMTEGKRAGDDGAEEQTVQHQRAGEACALAFAARCGGVAPIVRYCGHRWVPGARRRTGLLVERARDDADIRDAGLLDGIHDGGEGAEGHLFIGANVDDAARPDRR